LERHLRQRRRLRRDFWRSELEEVEWEVTHWLPRWELQPQMEPATVPLLLPM
jgi:hypothetical protein